MKWLALHIDTCPAGLEPVEALLSSLGIDGLVIEDEADFRRFLEENQQYWDYVDEDLDRSMTGKCRITFYTEEGEGGYTLVAAVRIALAKLKEAHPEYAPLIMTMDGLEDADWENNWRAFYKPMEIGERLIVVPDWETADPKGRVELRLEPGLAFGTGSHATTRLCLTELEKYVRRGMKMLDLGCGSGILSIAAMKLGASEALGVDVDPKSGDVAYENAALNGVGRPEYQVLVGDVLSDGELRRRLGQRPWNVILANIVADVIIPLSARAGLFLAPGGRFLCSGVIDTRADEVAAALEKNGLAVTEKRERGGWVSFAAEWRGPF